MGGQSMTSPSTIEKSSFAGYLTNWAINTKERAREHPIEIIVWQVFYTAVGLTVTTFLSRIIPSKDWRNYCLTSIHLAIKAGLMWTVSIALDSAATNRNVAAGHNITASSPRSNSVDAIPFSSSLRQPIVDSKDRT